jgi:hypothetical protein
VRSAPSAKRWRARGRAPAACFARGVSMATRASMAFGWAALARAVTWARHWRRCCRSRRGGRWCRRRWWGRRGRGDRTTARYQILKMHEFHIPLLQFGGLTSKFVEPLHVRLVRKHCLRMHHHHSPIQPVGLASVIRGGSKDRTGGSLTATFPKADHLSHRQTGSHIVRWCVR